MLFTCLSFTCIACVNYLSTFFISMVDTRYLHSHEFYCLALKSIHFKQINTIEVNTPLLIHTGFFKDVYLDNNN